ncbi:PepSY-associated TM helix domain-containing protein [Dokdonella sp. MW10]|uniref:PepSY-associated TM helix domain-containing protein n=1 Tax=Dokdonella sp. MW10 TaxID=2992926 RepID=UPI003F7CDDA0
MKLSSTTLRTFTTVHTWTGLIAGFALFVAFYAGAITVFHHDLPLWQAPHATARPMQTLDDAQRLLDGVLDRHPASRQWVGMLFPGDESPESVIYWPEADGTWKYATLDDLDGDSKPPHAGLAELVNELHYSLGMPVAGIWLMGIVSLLYGLALVSGTVIHLPKLAKDLFALRPGRNLKQFWQDAHNVVGVLSLPMHIMFAITGALLCLLPIFMLALDPLIYEGRLMQASQAALDTAPVRAAANTPAPPGSLALWAQRASEVAHERGLASFEPAYLKLVNAGDANAVVEITGAAPRALGPLGAVALDASTGALLADQLPGTRDANHATLASAYALHFGEYGNHAVPWLYFVLGVGGAFLFYSGNLLWIESRRRRRQLEQTRSSVNMARATVGVCIGLCAAISAAFVAAPLAEAFAPTHVDTILRSACFATWLAAIAWAALRRPALAARDLLAATAVLTLAIPLVHGACTGRWFWISAAEGRMALFWIDALAFAFAGAFAGLARATSRRARDGDPHSVWALPQTPD